MALSAYRPRSAGSRLGSAWGSARSRTRNSFRRGNVKAHTPAPAGDDGRLTARLASLAVLASLLLAASVVLFAAPPADALQLPGWMGAHSEADQQAVVDWAYRGAPQGVTPYIGDPAQ